MFCLFVFKCLFEVSLLCWSNAVLSFLNKKTKTKQCRRVEGVCAEIDFFFVCVCPDDSASEQTEEKLLCLMSGAGLRY